MNCLVFCISITKAGKSCGNCCLLETFHEIYEFSQLKHADQNKIFRQSLNCFSKAYALHWSDKEKMKQK